MHRVCHSVWLLGWRGEGQFCPIPGKVEMKPPWGRGERRETTVPKNFPFGNFETRTTLEMHNMFIVCVFLAKGYQD